MLRCNHPNLLSEPRPFVLPYFIYTAFLSNSTVSWLKFPYSRATPTIKLHWRSLTKLLVFKQEYFLIENEIFIMILKVTNICIDWFKDYTLQQNTKVMFISVYYQIQRLWENKKQLDITNSHNQMITQKSNDNIEVKTCSFSIVICVYL